MHAQGLGAVRLRWLYYYPVCVSDVEKKDTTRPICACAKKWPYYELFSFYLTL